MLRGKIRFPKEIPKDFLRKDRLLILLLSGILLLVITIPVRPEETETAAGQDGSEVLIEDSSMENYTQYLEKHLEEILTLIDNAGTIRVMVTLEDAGEKIVEKDTESTSESVEEADSEGGTRSSTNHSVKEVSIYEGKDDGAPYITREMSPVVAGVVVIAQGGDDAVVVRNITEAVQALFDIDTHKIKVIKGN